MDWRCWFVMTMTVLKMLRLQRGREEKDPEGSRPPVADAASDPDRSPQPVHPGNTSRTSHRQHLHLSVGEFPGHQILLPHLCWGAKELLSPGSAFEQWPVGLAYYTSQIPQPLGGKLWGACISQALRVPSAEWNLLSTVIILLLRRAFVANSPPLFTSPFPFQVCPVSLPE